MSDFVIYRQSAHPPEFQYVPIYANNPDPRLISYNQAVYGNLGFARWVILDRGIFFQKKKIVAEF